MVVRGKEGGKEAVGRLPVESGCREGPRNVVTWPGLLFEACKYRKLYPFNSRNLAVLIPKVPTAVCRFLFAHFVSDQKRQQHVGVRVKNSGPWKAWASENQREQRASRTDSGCLNLDMQPRTHRVCCFTKEQDKLRGLVPCPPPPGVCKASSGHLFCVRFTVTISHGACGLCVRAASCGIGAVDVMRRERALAVRRSETEELCRTV